MSQAHTAEVDEAKHVKRKTAALTIRMTQDTRDILDAAARRESRSASEMAEIWMTAASKGDADYRKRVGGSQVSEAIEALLQFAESVEEQIGNPRSYLPARDALLAGWKILIDRALPYTPDTPEGNRYRLARTNLRVLCRRLTEVLMDAGEDEDLLRYGFGSADSSKVQNALLLVSMTEPLVRDLQRLGETPKPYAVKNLARRLAASPPPAAVAELVAEIQGAIPAYLEAFEVYMEPRREAAERGAALAEQWNPPPLAL